MCPCGWSGGGTIKINNCTIKSSEFKITDTQDGSCEYSNVAGLIGFSVGASSLEIKNTNVIDTDINHNGTGRDNSAGGLIGFTFGNLINIENCEVKSTDGNRNKIEIYANDDSYSPIGGLIGVAGIESHSFDNVIIINSKVSGIEINDDTTSAAGGVIGYFKGSTLILDGVELEDMLLTLDESTKVDDGNAAKGGFIGIVSGGSTCITNSKFTNSVMNVKTYGSTGGIIGHSTNSNLISGLEIDNLKIIETANEGNRNRFGHRRSYWIWRYFNNRF